MRPIAYLLKMYPRFSETFILAEILELERQGVPLHIFSLRKPDDGRFHADLSRVRASVTYVPESAWVATPGMRAAHRQVFRWGRRRYLRVLWTALRRRNRPALRRFAEAVYLAPRLRRAEIAHVHAHFASSATSVALYLHQLTGTSYSFTAHAKDIYADGVDAEVFRRKLGSTRFAITVSDYNRSYVGASFGEPDRIVRIYNGLDLEQFALNGTLRERPPLVLAVGRLVEKKGFADVVAACAGLRSDGVDFRCLIVGKGPLEDELRRQVLAGGLGAHVQLPGAMPRDALLDLYPRASVVVAPCVVAADGNRDGLPMVLIEAMALGVPVISTDVTGIPELVEDGRTGVLVPQHDPEALARAIRRILDDPAGAAALARAGRARVERDFDLRQNVAELRTLFEQASAR